MAALIEREKAILSEQARESGKPEAVIEKMIMGRMKKFFEEVTLLNQKFVINPDVTVGQAATGTLGASAFTTSLTDTTANKFKRCFLRWLSGDLIGQVGRISAYAVSGGQITMETTDAFTGAPANGDYFEIISG